MESILLEIVNAYNQKNRYYHNMNHIGKMFEYARFFNIKLSDVQTYAIWFHDIVYVPGNKDNEEKSAEVAEKWLSRLNCMSSNIKIVKQIILDTKLEEPTCIDSGVVIDLDLLDIAYEDRYDKNKELIRKEFSHLNDEEFRLGRLEWLKFMMNRKTIFVSRYLNHSLEQEAKRILTKELVNLSVGKK